MSARDLLAELRRLPGGLSDADAERVIAEALHRAHEIRPCPLCRTTDPNAPECVPIERRMEKA